MSHLPLDSQPRGRSVGVFALFALAAGLAAVAVAGPSGCSASPCSVPQGTSDPTASFECASGQLCYQGQCRPSCNSGEENVTQCSSDSDCTTANIPHCSNGYCSACDNSFCIPQLNICESVAVVTYTDGGPLPPTGTIPPAPLDAGPIPVVSLNSDGGSVVTPTTKQTHIGTISLGDVTDYTVSANATPTFQFSAKFFDVSGGTIVTSTTPVFTSGDCEIDVLQTYPQDTPADVGVLKISQNTNSKGTALQGPLTATFVGGDPLTAGYTNVSPSPLPSNFLTLSKAGQEGALDLSSAGIAGEFGNWPSPISDGYHVPYALMPDAATTALLKSPIAISAVPQDLAFSWTSNPTPGVGETTSERVVVEIVGTVYRLHCERDESLPSVQHTISIKSAVITNFQNREHILSGSNATLKITFERTNRQTVVILPDGNSPTFGTATFEIRDAVIGRVVF